MKPVQLCLFAFISCRAGGEGACDKMDLRVAKGMQQRGYDKVRMSVITSPGHGLASCDTGDVFKTDTSYDKEFTDGQCPPDVKFCQMHLKTDIKDSKPGGSCYHDVGGTKVVLKTPAKGASTRGLFVADICTRSPARYGPRCAAGEKFKVQERINLAVNTLVGKGDVDYWGILGDNFYDNTGDITTDFFKGLTLEAKAQPYLVVPGNHDFWIFGAPASGSKDPGVDHFGYAQLQYYGQDVMASLSNGSTPYDFSVKPGPMSDPTSPPPWPGIPSLNNFITMVQFGDVAIFGFSGGHATSFNPTEDHAELDKYVETFCKWVGEESSINTWQVISHWSGYRAGDSIVCDLGCEPNLASPGVYRQAMKNPGCSAKRGVYWEGHDHQNHVLPNSYVDSEDPEPVGFDISAVGMNGALSGFAIIESVPDADGGPDVRVDYYPADNDANWKALADCWAANPGSPHAKCRSGHSDEWRKVGVSAAEKERLNQRELQQLSPEDIPACSAPAPPPGPPGPGPGPAPSPEATTAISEAAKAGDTELQVASIAGFKVGRGVTIDKGTPQEEANEISAFGSIILKDPLKYGHAAGTTIEMPQESIGGSNWIIYVAILAAVLIIAAIGAALWARSKRAGTAALAADQLLEGETSQMGQMQS